MAHSISFLLSSDAALLRMVKRQPRFVVHAEVRPHQFEELDADDEVHALALANSWLDHVRCISAAVREVKADGSLCKPRILSPEWAH